MSATEIEAVDGEIVDAAEVIEIRGLTRPHKPHKVFKRRGGPDWRENFLKAFVEFGTVVAACQATGVGRRTVYDRRKIDQAFAEAYETAEEMITESLEQEGIRRALDGSDRMLEFMLRARRPERYSEQHRLVHSGSIAGSDQPLTPEEERRELAAFAMPAATAVALGPEHVEPPADA